MMSPSTPGAFTTSCCAFSRLALPSRTLRVFSKIDRLDERLVLPEAGPSGIVKALAIFCPDALLGKQSLVESHQVSNKIGIVLRAVSGVVQRNDVTHGQYLRSEDSRIVPSPKRAVACRQLSGATRARIDPPPV